MTQNLRLLVCALLLSACNQWSRARTDPTAGGAGSGNIVTTGLPCDVDAVLGSYCRACHAAVPLGGAPMPLISYEDLMAPAKSDPSTRVADLCLVRMQDTMAPMPPAPPNPATSDIQTFAAWLMNGTPPGSCATGPDPLNAAPTCTSGQYWNGGSDGSSRMYPGRACIACHDQSGGEAPRFSIAGTVFPTGHEPDSCDATAVAGAQVVITGADGAVVTLTVNSVGNFRSSSYVALPYNAKVVFMGQTRAMAEAQMTGDCNSCHTQDGANGAPGRITVP